MGYALNCRAALLVDGIDSRLAELRVERQIVAGARVFDFGVHAEGGLSAGVELARVCLAGHANVGISSGMLNERSWPVVTVQTDAPVAACLLSQYAGWQISVGKYFGMGSGPMRCLAQAEVLFEKLEYNEAGTCCVGVIESSRLPDESVVELITRRTEVAAESLTLLVAPTASQAGTVQVVARSIETALHKLFELGFDVKRIVSAMGSAPLPPVAADDLAGIGRTNDAILYGAQVVLWVRGDDESLRDIGPRVPASASAAFGRPFVEIFKAAGGDFYAIDPHLFSPACITFQNLDTGCVHSFGTLATDVIEQSFGIGATTQARVGER